MSSPTTYLNADGLGVTDVSFANPLPTRTTGELDSAGAALPATFDSLKSVFYYDASGNLTSIRKTNGTVTMVADAPVIAGETLAYVKTFLNYASGSVAAAPQWVKQ
ncbi:hypothetical protein [Caulobacter rhizosphaerae]|uniref:hypothetical protein n=1 Tax=Caulobacter rhizosphaerae TaxID=2010972 RepID=UPI0013CF8013|nr:hypothetical protein [Caulobacter rhizosphaerae]GGL48386.1 hypothetical protein GCM10010983_52170 [Caulobacter rhizosphaerae]